MGHLGRRHLGRRADYFFNEEIKGKEPLIGHFSIMQDFFKLKPAASPQSILIRMNMNLTTSCEHVSQMIVADRVGEKVFY